jgi:hypothetical protein
MMQEINGFFYHISLAKSEPFIGGQQIILTTAHRTQLQHAHH